MFDVDGVALVRWNTGARPCEQTQPDWNAFHWFSPESKHFAHVFRLFKRNLTSDITISGENKRVIERQRQNSRLKSNEKIKGIENGLAIFVRYSWGAIALVNHVCQGHKANQHASDGLCNTVHGTVSNNWQLISFEPCRAMPLGDCRIE